jgi:teichuronic acid biosynthesis glycosyltransferase TuaC
MRVAVIAEYYPRPAHPGLGIWAHRQALAAREQGCDVRVLALDRPLPSLHALRSLVPGGDGASLAPLREWARELRRQPRRVSLDGIDVRYVRFLSPPRPLSYGSWGRWASPPLGRALDELERTWQPDLVHAHYAVPAGDAARRWIARRRPGLSLVVSVHGGDLTYAAPRSRRGREVVSAVLTGADAVIVNSTLTRTGVVGLVGERERLEVIPPGADPVAPAPRHTDPTLVTVAHLEQHKSQGDVIRALAALSSRHPRLRYVLVGRGPDRAALERLASSLGVAERVELKGGLPHEQTLAELARCHLHVMPSRHDAFGVAHVEAMAAGLPSVGGAGTGAEDIARAGEGLVLVRPGDVGELTRTLDGLLSDQARLEALGAAARQTVARCFSWRLCGERTASLYQSLVPPEGAAAA